MVREMVTASAATTRSVAAAWPQRLEALHDVSGMSWSEISRQTGIPYLILCRWRRGAATPRADSAVALVSLAMRLDSQGCAGATALIMGATEDPSAHGVPT